METEILIKKFKGWGLTEKYIVSYIQPELDNGWKLEEVCGHNQIISYNNGIVEYDQYAGFNTIEECNAFISEKSKISKSGSKKKKYTKFQIIENK